MPESAGAISLLPNVLAGFALLYFGREVFIPLSLAFVFATVLRPVVDRMKKWGIPSPASAGIVVGGGLLVLVVVGMALKPVGDNFAARLPELGRQTGAKLGQLPPPLNRLGAVVRRGTSQWNAADSATSPLQPTPAPHSDQPSGASLAQSAPMVGRIFGQVASVISTLIATLLLLLFILAIGDTVRERLAKRAATSALARGVLEVTEELHGLIARYLTLLTLINLAQATIITLAMKLIGMPVPIVWGAIAFFAEFFPYLGSTTMVILLALVGLGGSGGGEQVVLAPLIYLVVAGLQTSFVSPVTYGKNLRLSAAAILVSVMVWWLVWGVPGAFLAVPILALVRVICDRQKGRLAVLGAIVGG